ncbi:hypothetical protein GGI07_001952 [Coemansia sp. Benny D115]|nr:hypothetical protein GGI07_001952 [Coemansia sp. Benny D115]
MRLPIVALPITVGLFAATANAWPVAKPMQSLLPSVTFDTVIAFIPEKSSAPALSEAQAKTITNSIFSSSGYDLQNRFNEYSSGRIKFKGLGTDANVTFKYIDKGIDSCDRGQIVNAVYQTLAPNKPTRSIIVMNTRKPTCSGYSDNSGEVTMVWTVDALNPHVLFHELGHGFTFPHPFASACYSKSGQVMMSNNCTSIDGERFQNMGTIPHDSPWYKSDGVTNIAVGNKGSLEYSAYNRLSSPWPFLKESNVLDITGSGTYKLYNSETASIGDKAAVLRIPLNPPMRIENDSVSNGVTYHTHYYVEFVPRRANTVEGKVSNYVAIRTAPSHRARRTAVTRILASISTQDTTFKNNYYDGFRQIRITISSMDSNGASLKVEVPTGYGPAANVNECYYSSVIDSTKAVTVNNNNVCRALSRDNMPSTGTFNGTHCLIPYSNVGHIHPKSDSEFLHCLNTPTWIPASKSYMQDNFEIWDKSDMYVCKVTYENVLYQGRGHFNECCFYYNGGERCVRNEPTNIQHLAWLS